MMLIRTLFSIVSSLSPRLAARWAFKLFQKVRKKDIRKRELKFFESARSYEINGNTRKLTVYELGKQEGKLTILLHGWDSNAGSLYNIAQKLSEENRRVVTINMPAHAFENEKYTNLFIVKNCFKELMKYLNPQEPFDLVTHSFGSAVVSYAMSELDYKVDKMAFLTSPNKMIDIFSDFKKMIRLGDRSFSIFCQMASDIIGEDVKELEISKKLLDVNYEQLMIIHDENDKVIPFSNALAIQKDNSNVQVVPFQNIGHYRMLWNEAVTDRVASFII